MGKSGFGMGVLVGALAMLLVGAAIAPQAPVPLRDVDVTLHQFDMKPGKEAAFQEWMAMLHARHRDAVATLARERTYFEAMFTDPKVPQRLYWVTVQGSGGAPVESSNLDLDRRHEAFMADVLVKGSHRRLDTRNVLAPDFIVRAIQREQAEVEH